MNYQSIIAALKEEANETYNQLVQQPLNDNLKKSIHVERYSIHSLMRRIALDTKKRMKFNWQVKGDRPTNNFYIRVNYIKPNRGSNCILNSDGKWTSASDKQAHEVVCYFLKCSLQHRP